MKKSIIILIFITFSSFILLAVDALKTNKKEINIGLIQKKYIAGENIELSFNSVLYKDVYLIIFNTNGKSIINPSFIEGRTIFKVPSIFSKKAGVLDWKLIQNNKILKSNSFEIFPSSNLETSLETYFGPADIAVGNKNFASFITLPLDIYDNSLLDGTTININEKVVDKIENSDLKVIDMISYKNIYASTKSGKIFVSSNYKSNYSKELEIIVFPNQAQNFTIYSERLHNYADGNQTTFLKTTVIKDEYGNLIQNGTQVIFILTDNEGNILKTFGVTINGIAIAQILHPEVKRNYTIFAVVTGIAKSNTINLDYQEIIFDINYKFSNNNRTLEIGPITSYMNQLIQNGISVELTLLKDLKKIDILTEKSVNGRVIFNLPESFFPKGNYNFKIKVLGNNKTIENIKL
jgi:hypothetical protein